MSQPTIYWYPAHSSGVLEKTSLGEMVSELTEEPIRPRTDTRSLDGALGSTVIGASRLAVRIVLERFTDTSVAWALKTLSSYLERGDLIGFAVDPAKAWAGYLTVAPTWGDTVLYTTGDVWMGSGTLAAGDILVLEGLGAEGHREWVKVASVAGNIITLAAGAKYSYHDACVMVRHRWFYPALGWPEEEMRKPIVTTVRELHWTFDATLHSDPASMARLYEAGVRMLGTNESYNGLSFKDLSVSYGHEPVDTSGDRSRGVGHELVGWHP